MKISRSELFSKLRPWIVWGIASAIALYTFILQGAPSVMIAQLMQTYQIDVVQIGLITSCFFYTYIVMQIPAGVIVDLWGAKRVLRLSFFLCSFAVIWFAVSQSFWEGQISRMIMGLTAAPAVICAFWIGGRWFPPHLFTLIVALTECAALAGGVLGEAGTAQAVVTYGWRPTTLGIACIGFILTCLTHVVMEDSPTKEPSHPSPSKWKATLKRTATHLITVIAIKPLWINGLYAGLVFGIFHAFAALWGVPYFMTRYTITVNHAALIASMYFLGACFGTLVLGWTSAYITRKRPIIIGGTCIALLFSLSVIYLPNVPIEVMFVLVFGFGFFSSCYALAFAVAGTFATKQTKGVVMGLTNMLSIIFGAPLLQPMIGWLLKWVSDTSITGKIKTYAVSDYSIALLPIPIYLLLACLLALCIKEKKA